MAAGDVRFAEREVEQGDALDADETAQLARLYERLTHITFSRPREFAGELTALLRAELRLEAVSLYVRSEREGRIKLKAASGIDYRRYRSFEQEPESIGSLSLRAGLAYVAAEPPFPDGIYRDRAILEGLDVSALVVAPFGSPSIDVDRPLPDPLGCVCVYVGAGRDVERIGSLVSRLSPLIGTLYVAALDRYLMSVRDVAVRRAAFKGDIGSVVRGFLNVVQAEIHFEAASVWVWDSRRRQLYLRGSTGLVGGLMQRDVAPIDTDAGSTLARVMNSGELCYDVDADFAEHPPIEAIAGVLENRTHVPLRPTGEAAAMGQPLAAVGVLSLLNKFSEIDGVRHRTFFSWEDRLIAEFAAEVLAILIYQLMRHRDHESDYERQMHGAKTNLLSARSNLQMLRDRVGIEDKLPAQFQYYISNSIEWLDDIAQQIAREELIGNAALELGPVRLYGEVLAPTFRLARNRARAEQVGVELVGESALAEGYEAIPPVQGNVSALQCVFRNLVDNSIKYRERGSSSCIIDIEVRPVEAPDEVHVLFRDDGIGIGADEAELVFENRYRGRLARAVNTQGLGVGLYDCRSLLERMGGSIRVVRDRPRGTSFFVVLKVARERR